MKFCQYAVLLLMVCLPLHAYAENEAAKGYCDNTICSKVRSALERDSTLKPFDIQVQSDDLGAVHLSGTAKSQAEVSQAVIVARSVSGVMSVQNDIVIDSADDTKKR
ncbi:BON domain-containing protein [Methylobacillus rhizosphaerae]|uniref:BON domain-containing protein n=1 Tax=Methylobacillus rhizosphaerae TaxID=551994 RepID=A0A238YDJ4_9PROT|nr:BON domain-containing protein [Methylobacillus rhizosphaerae]SNR69120.1 BON domain-containing protein [Methylobacillus rhizosphaerae]